MNGTIVGTGMEDGREPEERYREVVYLRLVVLGMEFIYAWPKPEEEKP